jgi:hypothetical protein
MSSNKLNRPMFLFDADCGVCQNSTELMEKRINPPVDFRPYQSIDYASFGITTKNLSEGPILISTDGTFLVGPLGMATLLKMSRRPYSYMGRFMLLPGIRHFLKKVGPGLYAKRRYLPGATDSCAINPE